MSRQYFEDIADRWDEMQARFFSDGVREAALRRAGVRPGGLAADLGAGTGFITEALLADGLRVLAVDQSPAMLDQMRSKYGDAAKYLVGEAECLPIPNAHVDYVFANMYLHHVESPPDAIREAARILRSGGKLVITDLDAHRFEFLRTEQHDRWLGFERSQIEAWLRMAGLSGVSIESIGETCSASSDRGSDRADVTIFLAFGERLPETAVGEPKFAVRHALATDAPAIAAIYNQGIEERIATFETEPRSPADILAALQQRGERFPTLVAERDGRIVACAWVAPYRPRACYAGVAEFSVYTEREARGTGAGRAVLSALIEECERRGCWKLVSRIFPENTASLALCRRLGFREVGVYHRHARLDGRWRDCVIVERLLGEGSQGDR